MKFYVINDKFSRIALTVIVAVVPTLLWLALFVIALVNRVNLWQEWLGSGVWVAVVLVIMISFTELTAIYFILMCYSTVVIDENGVVFCTGKLVHNRAAWQQIENIQLVEVWGKGEKRLCINIILKKGIDLFNSRRASLNIFGKKKINFMFNRMAFDEIQKHYHEAVEDYYLIHHYTDFGVPKDN